MPTPNIIRYPLDPTGISANNLVQGELHTMERRRVRAIAPQYGAFYTTSLKVFDTATQIELVKGVQYYPAELYEVPTARFGKEVCAVIIITDETVGDQVSIDYQAVGGDFSNSVQAIIQQVENLMLDDRPIKWGDIFDKPSEYSPSHHLHDLGDIYGFEYLVHAVDRVRAAILLGDSASHDEIYAYIDSVFQELADIAAEVQANLNAHIANKNNPHEVTAEQLNVYIKGAVDTLITNMQTLLTNALVTHASDTTNPHNVTAAQLNVYLASEVDSLLVTITNTVEAELDTHKLDMANPHQVTKDQVGLSSVENFPPSSSVDAVAGVNNASYMTPLRSREAIVAHSAGGDHDGRYVQKNLNVELALRDGGGVLQSFLQGGWRTVWPPQWQ